MNGMGSAVKYIDCRFEDRYKITFEDIKNIIPE